MALPDGIALWQGCQIIWLDVHVNTCATIYHKVILNKLKIFYNEPVVRLDTIGISNFLTRSKIPKGCVHKSMIKKTKIQLRPILLHEK